MLERLQKNCDAQGLAADFNALFVGNECRVSPYRSAWVDGATEAEVRAFLSTRGMPLTDAPADHFGTLLLAASWLEDQSAEDESEALETLFAEYLLPWCGTFLGKVEAHATTPFWRTMAPLTRDAISAMWDELQESAEE
jgi:TorA maturation chaperone TorD